MKKMAASILLVFGLAIVLNSCKKDDPPLPPNNINFQAAEIGLGASETEATVTLTLSREADEATSVTRSDFRYHRAGAIGGYLWHRLYH